MTHHDKHIAALTRAVKKAKNPGKVKAKIRHIKQRKATSDWLAQ